MIYNSLTFDVEDWYQGFIYRGISGWEKYGSRESKNVQRILGLLYEYNTKATFFVLGSYAENNHEEIKLILNAGHEIASHGYSHIPVPQHTRASFREDVKRTKKLLEDITGKKISGHRAASWSINKDCLWALDILAEEGYLYDSSIFPTRFHSFGINNYPAYPRKINLQNGGEIYEFPAQVLSLGNIKIPAAGGFFMRAFPYFISELSIKQSQKKENPGMVYLHPFDLDPEAPKLKTKLSFKIVRYYNLSKTEKYLRRLLSKFNFTSIEKLVNEFMI